MQYDANGQEQGRLGNFRYRYSSMERGDCFVACRSFGSSSRNVSRDVHAELGYAHAEVAKVELVVWPWRNNPRRQLRMEANGEVHEGAGTADVTANEDGWAADQTAEGAVKASADRSGGGPIGKGKEVLAQLQHHIKELQHSWQPDGSASTS